MRRIREYIDHFRKYPSEAAGCASVVAMMVVMFILLAICSVIMVRRLM